jgi:GH15 family glucan-1,4-alpha-glucosidase
VASRIEDYALIGDCLTCALVSRTGSIDWTCVPYFDSSACFAALLGTEEHGRWLIAPQDSEPAGRRYRDGTLILETDFRTSTGEVTLIDFMPPRTRVPQLVRIVAGKRGKVQMRMELAPRFDYGSIGPWVRRAHVRGAKGKRRLRAVGGPDALVLDTPVEVRRDELTAVADFEVSAGQRVPFVLAYHPSQEPPPDAPDAEAVLKQTESWWREWSGRCTCQGEWRDAVQRSLITLKALTFAPTGGIVAAATTSLPEQIGGVRNWDYRFCWVRDATFTLYSLISNGYVEEARAWREWLRRAVAGKPSQMNIMYGIDGRRRLTELELAWLPGYEDSKPVRTGNAAHEQFQLDVFGELIDAMYQARRAGLEPDDEAWKSALALMHYLTEAWHEPGEGIWEVRGPRQHFTHSKVMAWVAFDRVVKSVEQFGRPGPVEEWRKQRDQIHEEVCRAGYDKSRNTFVQYYGSKELDASLLMIPLVGFLPAKDPRVIGTVEAVQRELKHDGLVARYLTGPGVDGLPPGEGAFLACSFWLADCLHLLGRDGEARELFERLLSLRNDVGLLSEEYDPGRRRLVGNFPQAFSHVGLVNTALNLSRPVGPARDRQSG